MPGTRDISTKENTYGSYYFSVIADGLKAENLSFLHTQIKPFPVHWNAILYLFQTV
jgi:hypothetical protein